MTSRFHVVILTIFPEMFPGTLNFSLIGKALKKGLWSYEVVNIRDFGIGKHKQVDDKPYGGMDGLVMRVDVLDEAIKFAIEKFSIQEIYYMSPKGKHLDQSTVHQILATQNILVLCGRFQGIDERIITKYNVRSISLGDFILSGGEVAALALIESCVRLIPGVVGNADSLSYDSFESEISGMLEHAMYTRPFSYEGLEVPKTLASGNHAEIEQWKRSSSLSITKHSRPDLLKTKN
jgi:tRNA (guanine37-N1)-methyltransferase